MVKSVRCKIYGYFDLLILVLRIFSKEIIPRFTYFKNVIYSINKANYFETI